MSLIHGRTASLTTSLSPAMTEGDMTMYIFSVDGGGTKTRGTLYTFEGDEVATSVGESANLLRGVDKAIEVVREIWRVLCEKADTPSDSLTSQTIFVAGLAGAQFKNDRDRFLEGVGGFSKKIICSDGYLALIAATQGKPGSLLVVGTGVVGHRLQPDNTSIEVGGWGFPTGDIGGGAWLGWRAVESYAQWFDNKNFRSSMWDEIGNIIGNKKRDIVSWTHNATPSKFGSLAPIVINAMEEGDSIANEIFIEGLHGIYSLSMALRDESHPCFYAGGLSEVVVKALNLRYEKANARLSKRSPNWGAYLIGVGEVSEENSNIQC